MAKADSQTNGSTTSTTPAASKTATAKAVGAKVNATDTSQPEEPVAQLPKMGFDEIRVELLGSAVRVPITEEEREQLVASSIRQAELNEDFEAARVEKARGYAEEAANAAKAAKNMADLSAEALVAVRKAAAPLPAAPEEKDSGWMIAAKGFGTILGVIAIGALAGFGATLGSNGAKSLSKPKA